MFMHKDMLQLVDDTVHVMHPKTRALIGPDEVRARFGVSPEQLCDLLVHAPTTNTP